MHDRIEGAFAKSPRQIAFIVPIPYLGQLGREVMTLYSNRRWILIRVQLRVNDLAFLNPTAVIGGKGDPLIQVIRNR